MALGCISKYFKDILSVDTFRYIHSWSTQKECFTPKSFSRPYFEWPLHLRNNLFSSFFFIRYSHTSWLKWWWFFVIWIIQTCPFKFPKTWFRNCVPLRNFIKNDSIGLKIFVQISPYLSKNNIFFFNMMAQIFNMVNHQILWNWC
jgi:hypothetical protein